MKFQDLNRKEKLEYIWDYYKLHIISGVIVLLIIIYSVNTFLINPPPEPILHVALMGEQIDMMKTEQLALDLELELLGEDRKSSIVSVDTYFMNSENANPNMVMASSAKFMANLKENLIDVIAIDEDQFIELYDNGGIFMELDKVLDKDTLTKLEDRLIVIDDKIYGIDVTGNPLLGELMYSKEKKILSLYSNTERLEDSLKIYYWILEQR